MERSSDTVGSERRLDLDWVRIGAFGLLILYHVGMFYVPWSFHVKSPRVQDWLVVPMVLTNPWRLSLLFLVSGAATRFMSAKISPGGLARARTSRLLPPLVFGMLVVVPPQSWMQVVEWGHRIGYLDFYGRYLQGDHSFCKAHECLMLPTWNHLWFVVYLLVYSLLLTLWIKLAPRRLQRLQHGLERALSGWRVLALPTAALVTLRLLLAPHFPETHTLVNDWCAHAVYGSTFLFGYLLARSERVWEDLVSLRWVSLALGAAAFLAYAAYVLTTLHAEPAPGMKTLMRLVYGVDQWSWIAAVLGFARLHLSTRDGPVRRYLTDAIFPFYIVHQTTIVVAGHYLARRNLPLGLEAGLLIALTAASCFLTYEVVRRVGWLRPLFGLKRRTVVAAPRAVPALPPRLAEDVC